MRRLHNLEARPKPAQMETIAALSHFGMSVSVALAGRKASVPAVCLHYQVDMSNLNFPPSFNAVKSHIGSADASAFKTQLPWNDPST